MKKYFIISTVVLLGLILAACSGPTSSAPAAPSNPTSSVADLTQTKDEASVTVKVTPLNLGDKSAATLDFEIVLDTHSVDLTYDLVSIATLRSDAGDEVQPEKWDGPTGGGHHVSGTLSFPQMTDRRRSLMLILRGIAGVPERTFVWKVN